MKRLNVKLALWLVGIMVFSVVGVYFLHAYQEDRNASFLKVQAEQARNEGNDLDAIKHYSQYVRHRDDREGYKVLAELTVKVAKDSKATKADHMRAYNLLEESIRRYPDMDEARLSLVDYMMAMRRYGDALEHIATLQENGNKDATLELKKAACHVNSGNQEAALKILHSMVGYDPETKQFLPEAPATAKEPEAFLSLARMMRAKGDATGADAMMKKLVEWNPDSAKAHLTRAAYDLSVREMLMRSHGANAPQEVKDAIAGYMATGKEELKRAAEIEPENADGLLMIGGIAIQEQDFPRAQELLDQALKLHPSRQEVYLRRSVLAFAQGDQKKAAAELQSGLTKAENTQPLLEQLIEIQFNLRDLPAARATCEQMKKIESIPPEYIRYQEARLKFGEGQVIEAARELEQVRPAMERLGTQYLNSIDTLLGRSYELMGMPDRQLEVYRRLLSTYPNQIQAMIGETAALQALGRHAEAENSVKLLAESAHADPAQLSVILQLLVNQELSKPAAERNWQQVDKLTAMLEETGQRTPLQSQLLKAELLIAQGKSGEARAVLDALRKEHPKELAVWMSLCKLMTSDEKFRDRLPQLLTLAEKEIGNVAPLQAERIKIVARGGGEQASAELQKLEAGSKSFEPAQQQGLIALLGAAYLQVGDYENGKRCLHQIITREGTNLRVRQALFDLAMERQDDATAEKVIEELRKSPFFGTQSALYKYCNSAFELQKFARRRQGKTTPLTAADLQKLAEIRKSMDEAIAQRAEWAPLWRVRGEVDQIEGNLTSAIANFQRSLDYSRAGQTGTARRLVMLLYAAKRYTEANEAMKYLEGSELSPEMRRVVEATKWQSGNISEALEMAKNDVAKDPENPGSYLWYGQLLEVNGDFEGSEKAFREAVAKGPKLAGAWENLVRRLSSNSKPDEAQATAKQAAAALGDAPLELGRIYQRAGDLAEAEKQYKLAIDKDPSNLLTRRLLAELYLLDKQVEPAMAELNKIIELGTASKDPQATANLAWARTQKARNFAPSRDYANTMEAIKLIEQNTQDGKLSPSDMMAIVAMLAPRTDEPSSRAKAIELLEKISQAQSLNTAQLISLARLYERNGDWEKARDTMTAALNTDGKNPEACLIFAEMLFNHEAFDEARQYVDRAEDLLQDSFSQPSSQANQGARLLKARLLVNDGKSDEAAKLLENWLPRPLPQNNLVWLEQVAGQTEALKLDEAADRLYEEYATLEPRQGKLALAAYRGRRGDLDQSFALLEQSRESASMLEILPVALANIRSFPEKATPEQFKQFEQWAQSAMELTNDPERLKLLIAELYDLQGRYDDVVKIYRELLANEKTSRITRAIVQNNLAFILAAVKPTPQSGAEAQKLIEQAIAVLGPTSDLLDTRALTFLAQGKVDQAAADLRAAVGDRPTTAKYYHLAQVEKKLGNADEAKTAIAKAEELHGERNQFTPFERKGYELLKREMN